MIITEGLVIVIRKLKFVFFVISHRNTVHLIVNKTLVTKYNIYLVLIFFKNTETFEERLLSSLLIDRNL